MEGKMLPSSSLRVSEEILFLSHMCMFGLFFPNSNGLSRKKLDSET